MNKENKKGMLVRVMIAITFGLIVGLFSILALVSYSYQQQEVVINETLEQKELVMKPIEEEISDKEIKMVMAFQKPSSKIAIKKAYEQVKKISIK